MTAGSVLGLGLWLLKRLNRNLWPIVLATSFSLADELLSRYFAYKYHNNLLVYYIGNCAEHAGFAWFIAINVDSLRLRKWIGISNIVYAILLMVFLPFYLQQDVFGRFVNQRYFVIGSSFLLCVWAGFYFKGIFDRITKYEYLDVYVLLIVSGILFYYAFSAVFFAAQNYLINISIKENPNLFTDAVKVKKAAFSYTFQQYHDVHTLLFITNILLYTCILISIARNAFPDKKQITSNNYSL